MAKRVTYFILFHNLSEIWQEDVQTLSIHFNNFTNWKHPRATANVNITSHSEALLLILSRKATTTLTSIRKKLILAVVKHPMDGIIGYSFGSGFIMHIVCLRDSSMSWGTTVIKTFLLLYIVFLCVNIPKIIYPFYWWVVFSVWLWKIMLPWTLS